ncbi:hypothetical protein GCM10009821_26380 [Aeromicrobium halocynthiae]|uniref:LLM class flavin-dependent oxidoreductase n=1 Tax=Aeromicrobium halocynthiae TaxID=560557 RepID=A0ABN2W5E5_9ACTN
MSLSADSNFRDGSYDVPSVVSPHTALISVVITNGLGIQAQGLVGVGFDGWTVGPQDVAEQLPKAKEARRVQM